VKLSEEPAGDPAGPRIPLVTPPAAAKRPERVCPNCGRELIERKCKLLCPNGECGYYMSCSDFY
jgi:hypothetical protein